MSLKIKANTFVTVRYLEIHSDGVTFCETAAMGGKHRFTFAQIEYLYLSPQNVLSFQVGTEVFSVPMKLDNAKQKLALDSLLGKLRAFPN